MGVRVEPAGIDDEVDKLRSKSWSGRVNLERGFRGTSFVSGIGVGIIPAHKVLTSILWLVEKHVGEVAPVDKTTMDKSSQNHDSPITERLSGGIPSSLHELRRVVIPGAGGFGIAP
jgi:hypothetical protein